MNLTNQLYDYLHDCGAALVGFADMSMDKSLVYPTAVSVAIPVPPDIVQSLKISPNKAYYNTYNEMNGRLNKIVTKGAEYLRDKGYNAVAMTKSKCGSCTICVKCCPAEALSGTLWEAGMERSRLFDEQKCYQKQVQIMTEQTGIKKDLCGKCFAVCAFTQKYIGE